MKRLKLPQIDSREELAQFWDAHDLTEFEAEREEVTEAVFERKPETTIHRERKVMNYAPLNFREKLAKFSDHWFPKVIAEMNDYQFKLVKVRGDFVWHNHKDTDEVFIVLNGQVTIEFRDGAVELSAGEMFVVPKGVEHKPFAQHECHLLLVEPRGVINTGDAGGKKTADNEVWV